jgi:hypothetical protein
MGIVRKLSAVIAAAFQCAAAWAQEAVSATTETGISPEQQDALKKGTALFIVTLLLLLVMLVGVIIATIMLRRSVAATGQRKKAVPTDFESLWWKTGEDDRKKN